LRPNMRNAVSTVIHTKAGIQTSTVPDVRLVARSLNT
jgi:hypothetical protein